jgi:hypothetical protein
MGKLFIMFALMISVNLNAQEVGLGTIINKAGRQRMLVQRMTKDYMSIGANIKKEESAKDIDDVTALFNESLVELIDYAKNDETKEALSVVSDMWAKYRVKMAYEPNIQNAESILIEALKLTKACNTVVEKFQAYSGNSANKLTNMCGKQRMGLQKIAMLYMAKNWGVNYNYLDKELEDAIATFDANLITLVNAKENTDEIKKGLKFQQAEWDFLKKSFDAGLQKPGNIYSSTNLMTKSFDALTVMYSKLVTDNVKFVAK